MESLSIGAVPISSFPAGTYSKCTTSACNAVQDAMTVWVRGSSGDVDSFDMNTIFEVPSRLAGQKPFFLANKESVVSLGSNQFSFRNPPGFIPLAGEVSYPWAAHSNSKQWNEKAHQEIDAVIDHFFEHPNTAPFVVYRLIQRMVTSNPSPRYIESAVNAFRTGRVGERTFSGKYGDMGAAVFAIFTDQEARSTTIEADPRFGLIREPFLKVMHMIRSMDLRMDNNMEIDFTDTLAGLISQEPFHAPSVFGFYKPEHRPLGVISDAGLVSPESEILTSPEIIMFLNGMASLIRNGFTNCQNGFGFYNISNYGGCWESVARIRETAHGLLNYNLPNGTTAEEIVDKVSLLLTAGRLAPRARDQIIKDVTKALESKGQVSAGVATAQTLMTLVPEFHSTNANMPSEKTRAALPEIEGTGKPYKAVVVLFLEGGSDSFNFFVPYDGCGSKNLYTEYANVRQGATVTQGNLQPITVNGQPCARFGIHSSMPNLENMYNDGDMAVLANVGPLVEPVTRDDYYKGAASGKKFPPSLFAHNTQIIAGQSLNPQDRASKGVLGRIIESLTSQTVPVKSEVYSIAGANKAVEGKNVPNFVDAYNGVPRYNMYTELFGSLQNITKLSSESVFAETINSRFIETMENSEKLGAMLSATTTTTVFPDTYIGRQLAQVARLVKLRTNLTAERDIFFTKNYGYDTHATFNLNGLFGDVDAAVAAFKSEMMVQGTWDDVTLVCISDFARTLSSNGRGTDHGWGGHYFVVGGDVEGRQVFGTYPGNLTAGTNLEVGYGRFVPTMGWDQVWSPIVKWFGVEDNDVDFVLPNLKNFPSSKIITQAQMFKSSKKRKAD